MITSRETAGVSIDELTTLVAKKVMGRPTMIMPFADSMVFMEELLKIFYEPGCRLIAGGHVTPEIELAAHRAEVELVEVLGPSVFSSDLEGTLAAVGSPSDLIYVANPNRVTGTSFSFSDLEQLARAIPQGTMFIDEYYYDYSGISGYSLLDLLTNVIIFRSLTASFAISSSDAGFILANPKTLHLLQDSGVERPLSSKLRKTLCAAFIDSETISSRLHQTHEESLRLATELCRLKMQCRITSTDFVLLRVASPKRVGNFLSRYRIPVDNLEGYPRLQNYLRYRVQSPFASDRLLEAFKKMPTDFYLMASIDRHAVTIRRPQDNVNVRKGRKDSSGNLGYRSFAHSRAKATGKQ